MFAIVLFVAFLVITALVVTIVAVNAASGADKAETTMAPMETFFAPRRDYSL